MFWFFVNQIVVVIMQMSFIHFRRNDDVFSFVVSLRTKKINYEINDLIYDICTVFK